MKSPPMMFQSPSLRGSGRFEGKVRVSIRSVTRFNPLHCGAVVASPQREAARGKEETWFQSPSLRGSGRFVTQPPWHTQSHGSCFNPLHCGAVVASERRARDAERRAAVSIPFIAGQWSLREAEARAGGQGKRFNPLHCGAVVASGKVRAGSARTEKVSIPFIAGQWSLQRLRNIVEQDPRVSIPFIAGQWSLRLAARRGGKGGPHVSIPFIAGQWSLQALLKRLRHIVQEVSIPFIAGQWSLPSPGSGPTLTSSSFNPLHCGAVVASWTTTGHRHRTCRVSIPFIAGQWSLRAACRRRPAAAQRVSIPFIAGQWSLPDGVRCGECVACRSFNPLHCGAVVASWTTTGHRHRTCRVSIPFIAGQWSLHQQMGGDGH